MTHFLRVIMLIILAVPFAAHADPASCQSDRSSLKSQYASLNGSQKYSDWAKGNPLLAERSAVATKILNELWSRLTPSTQSVIRQYQAGKASFQSVIDALSPAVNSLSQEANFMDCGNGSYQQGNFLATCDSTKLSAKVLAKATGSWDGLQHPANEMRSLNLTSTDSDNDQTPDHVFVDLQITDGKGGPTVHLSVPIKLLLQQTPFTRMQVLSRNFDYSSMNGAMGHLDPPVPVTYPKNSTSAHLASLQLAQTQNNGSMNYPLTQDEYVFAHLPAQCQTAERDSVRPLDVSSPLAIIDSLNGAPSQPGTPGVATGDQRQPAPAGVVAPAGSNGQDTPSPQTPAR